MKFNAKTFIIATFVVFATIICTGGIGYNSTQNFQVIQSMGGDMSIQSQGGYYGKFFPKVWTYDKVRTIYFSSDREESKDNDGEKEPAVKKQFVIVVNDPYGKIGETGFEYQGWVVQIPEDAAPMEALEKLHKGVYDFNLTPKGRRMPIKTIAEACEFGSAKLYKEHKIWVKTKDPVLVLRTNGKIPHDVVDA